jgi:predicted nucleic acid-binding protein
LKRIRDRHRYQPLVYTHRESTPQHAAARAVVVRALEDPHGWGISLPSVAEFWSIVTHPDQPGEKSTATKAAAFIHYLVTEGHGHSWTPGPGFGERLLR